MGSYRYRSLIEGLCLIAALYTLNFNSPPVVSLKGAEEAEGEGSGGPPEAGEGTGGLRKGGGPLRASSAPLRVPLGFL